MAVLRLRPQLRAKRDHGRPSSTSRKSFAVTGVSSKTSWREPRQSPSKQSTACVILIRPLSAPKAAFRLACPLRNARDQPPQSLSGSPSPRRCRDRRGDLRSAAGGKDWPPGQPRGRVSPQSPRVSLSGGSSPRSRGSSGGSGNGDSSAGGEGGGGAGVSSGRLLISSPCSSPA